MSSTSEVGHTKNVGNFEILINYCTGYGAAYNPTKSSIKVPALTTLLTNAKNSLVATNIASIPYNKAKHARAIVFEPLSPLVTRIFAALDSTDASKQVIANAKTLKRKLQGARAGKKAIQAPNEESELTAENPKEISDSQMSFDNKIEHFSRLLLILVNEPLYVPNEADLKVTTLTSLLASMRATNSAVMSAKVPLENARNSRNKILYLPVTGLYEIQGDVKKYVKAVYGAKSLEFKQVSKLRFVNYPLI